MRPGELPVEGGTLLGLRVKDFGALDFEGLTIEAPLEFSAVPKPAIKAAWPQGSATLGEQVAEDLVAAGARFVAHIAAQS